MSAAGVHLPVILQNLLFRRHLQWQVWVRPYRQKTRLYAYTNTKICPCLLSQILFLQSLAFKGKHWQYAPIQQILAEALLKKVPIAISRKVT